MKQSLFKTVQIALARYADEVAATPLEKHANRRLNEGDQSSDLYHDSVQLLLDEYRVRKRNVLALTLPCALGISVGLVAAGVSFGFVKDRSYAVAGGLAGSVLAVGAAAVAGYNCGRCRQAENTLDTLLSFPVISPRSPFLREEERLIPVQKTPDVLPNAARRVETAGPSLDYVVADDEPYSIN